MRWTRSGANALLQVRCCCLERSGRAQLQTLVSPGATFAGSREPLRSLNNAPILAALQSLRQSDVQIGESGHNRGPRWRITHTGSQRHMRARLVVMAAPNLKDRSQVCLRDRNQRLQPFAAHCASIIMPRSETSFSILDGTGSAASPTRLSARGSPPSNTQ